MNTKDAIQWLYDKGGPVIRRRTAAELMSPGECGEPDKLRAELVQSPVVKTWLDHLDPACFTLDTYHCSADACYENALGVLSQLGVRAGMPVLDEKTLPLRRWLQSLLIDDHNRWDLFAMLVVCSLLAAAGYRDPAIITFLKFRLTTLYCFALKRDYGLYDDPAKYKGVPTGFKGRPIIKPELYAGANYQFPLVYDLIGMAALSALNDLTADERINVVLCYILTEEYHQKIAGGYGILAEPGRKYHSMGWDCLMPGFLDIGEDDQKQGALMLARAALLAMIPAARHSRWFTSVIAHLEGFQTERGTYLFPRHYLKDGTGYFVSAMHMGLGENRREKDAREKESTFWMLLIKKRAGLI